MKKISILIFVIVAAVGGTALYAKLRTDEPKAPPFRTAKAKRGDLMVTVSATGTLEPEEVVDVGAQVTGRIKEMGLDPRGRTDSAFANKRIDYGSPVEEGMLLAQLDPSIYKAQYDQADASLVQAKANVLQMEAKLMQADAEWKRAQRLRALKLVSRSPTGSPTAASQLPIKGISDADFILAEANCKAADANLAAAKGTVLQMAAALELAKTNLGYTTIKSPVNGTIIDRRMNIGQTCVANLTAQSLFLIARDLRRMQIWATVNEADIGRLKVGTQVNFRVDAFPGEVFRGEVFQIRLNASMTQNVVTYIVVISADNSSLRLLPYLTANVKFEVNRRDDALLIPNAALRFQPKPEQVDPEARATVLASAAETKSNDAQDDREPNEGTVWLPKAAGEFLYPVNVHTGLTDGSFTEVIGDELADGSEVVLGETRGTAAGDVINPLGPPKFRGTPRKDKGK